MSRFLCEKLSGLSPYVPGEQPQKTEGLIKLNTNESPYPPSPLVTAAISKAECERLNLYSDPECRELIAAIAEAHSVNAENIFVGNGSDEILAFCFHGLTPSGAAFPDLTYGFYRVYAALYGLESFVVPLKEDMTIDVSDFRDINATVFIANPNAPTGICLPLADIESLLRQNASRLVVVDEAYVEFGGESALPLLAKYDNLLIVRTFSKSRALAGARIGYAMGSAELIADLNRLKFSFNPYNINRLSIIAGAAAMRDREYFKKTRDMIIETRDFASRELCRLGFKVLPSKANFVFAGQHPGIAAGEYFTDLRRNGIFIRYFDLPRAREYVRITIGTMEQMQKLIEATEALAMEARYEDG